MIIRVRKIEEADHRTVIDLLQDISKHVPDAAALGGIWSAFQAQPHVVGMVAVTEEHGAERVIGYGSLCVDIKIRGGSIGHIEDIVVAPNFRGRGVGSLVVRSLMALASERKCYKVALECRDEKKAFYAQMGFVHSGCGMSLLLPPNGA